MYALITLPFLALTALVTLATLRRPAFGRRMAASSIAAAVLIVLTAVFDNVMIAAGLFTYPAEHLTGVMVGLAPIEDFTYALCAAFLVPSIFTLVGPRAEAMPA